MLQSVHSLRPSNRPSGFECLSVPNAENTWCEFIGAGLIRLSMPVSIAATLAASGPATFIQFWVYTHSLSSRGTRAARDAAPNS